ncbi:MAG TPA: hypothetical protein VM260_23060 [Pirellula sp.]|nr:hypothetical protein [Pirellula sp.]
MLHEFLAKDVHVLVPEYYKMIECFLTDALDETFYESNCVRRTNRRPMKLDLGTGNECKKWF